MVDGKENDLYLLIDIDDLLVRSSDILQAIVNEATNFKTEVLQMFEQLNRNCNYMVSVVEQECNKAKDENREPNLSQFKVFKGCKLPNDERKYTEPVKYVQYFADVANKLLNQFLEERDTFLEIDNMSKGSRKYFDRDKEINTIIEISEFIDNNKDFFHQINAFSLREAKKIRNKAINQNKDGKLTIPNYGPLVKMDSNDIIKKNSIDKNKNKDDKSYKEYVLYTKPIENIKNCIRLEKRIHDIISNARVFGNHQSKEIVDYRYIHRRANVNEEAVELIRKLIASGIFKGVYFSTHHNGGREEKAKIALMRELFPEIPEENFIGQRFHDEEHDGKRRGRSSKVIRAAHKLHVLPSQLVLLDDSKENCKDCKEHGGLEILYKPRTDSEIINGKIEDTGFNRILSFNGPGVYEYICDLCNRHKEKITEKAKRLIK